MKKIKIYSIIVLTAIFAACTNQPKDPTTVKFTSGDAVSAKMGTALTFDVSVKVSNPQGKTTFAFSGLPDWLTKSEGDNKVTLSGTPTERGEFKVSVVATNNKVAAEHSFVINVTEDGGGSTGEGTKANPFSVEKVIELNPQSTTEAVKKDVWVQGFIVGCYNSTPNPSVIEQTAPFSIDANIMLASSATETDRTKMICIQLPIGAVRTALELKTSPQNFGKEIKLYGDILKYNNFPGLKNTTGYWWIETDTGIEPPQQGSFDVPVITVAELKAMHTGTDVQLTGENKVVAVVTSDLTGGNSTSKKNLTITSEDNTSGITIRLTDRDNTYALGTKVEVLLTGTLSVYAQSLQFQVALINTRSMGTASITPRQATVAELTANAATYECCVVKTSGVITNADGKTTYGSSSAHQTNILTDSGNNIDMFVSKYSNFVSEAIPTGVKTVTAIAQLYNGTPQLIMRNIGDIQ